MEKSFQNITMAVIVVVIFITIINMMIPTFVAEAEHVVSEGIRYASEVATGVERKEDSKTEVLMVAKELENISAIAEIVKENATEGAYVEPTQYNFYFDENNVAYQATKTIEVKATAYCHCKKCCGKEPGDEAYGITKSGLNLLAPGANIRIVAADPEVLPLGTKIYIEVPEEERDTMYVTADYGIATVEDTGGAIDGNRIDVYFPTHQEACEWGIRYVQVHVIVPVE